MPSKVVTRYGYQGQFSRRILKMGMNEFELQHAVSELWTTALPASYFFTDEAYNAQYDIASNDDE